MADCRVSSNARWIRMRVWPRAVAARCRVLHVAARRSSNYATTRRRLVGLIRAPCLSVRRIGMHRGSAQRVDRSD